VVISSAAKSLIVEIEQFVASEEDRDGEDEAMVAILGK